MDRDKLKRKTKNHEKVVTFLKVIILFAVMIFAIRLVSQYVITRTVVDGNSMFPTLKDGDNLIIFNLQKSFKRYDIVVFNSDINNREFLIKRVIGLPGENVKIDRSGNIYINDELLKTEKYAAHTTEDPGLALYDSGGVDLGEDEYFVMGDNRNHSEDSRFAPVGNIKRKDIAGKVVIRIWPIETFGNVDLYRERTQATVNTSQ